MKRFSKQSWKYFFFFLILGIILGTLFGYNHIEGALFIEEREGWKIYEVVGEGFNCGSVGNYKYISIWDGYNFTDISRDMNLNKEYCDFDKGDFIYVFESKEDE